MNDSEENVETGAGPHQSMRTPVNANTRGLTSLSEWAEFSFLIQKLDGEYAETLDNFNPTND